MRQLEVGRKVREVVLTLGAVLGGISLLVGLAVLTLDVRPLVFRSGSMSPTIDTGSLALARPASAEDLRVGDVVSVTTSTGDRVTHRIVDLTLGTGAVTLRLQGDANQTADLEVYRVTEADRVFTSVPGAGYVIGWLTGPAGLFLLGLYAAFLFSVILRGNTGAGGTAPRPPGSKRAPTPRSSPRRRRMTMASVGTTLCVGSVLAAPPSWAAWTDPVSISGTTLSAGVLSPPVVSCGGLQVGSVTITWTAVPGATGYRLSYGAAGTTTENVAAGVTSKNLSGSGTFSVRTLGLGSWVSASSNSKQYASLALVLGTCS